MHLLRTYFSSPPLLALMKVGLWGLPLPRPKFFLSGKRPTPPRDCTKPAPHTQRVRIRARLPIDGRLATGDGSDR